MEEGKAKQCRVGLYVYVPRVAGHRSDGGGHSACHGWCQQTVSLGTAGASREESVKSARREWKETVDGLFVWVTALLVLSPLVPSRKLRKKKKNCLFTPLSPVSPSRTSYSLFNWNENPSLVQPWPCDLLGSQTSSLLKQDGAPPGSHLSPLLLLRRL